MSGETRRWAGHGPAWVVVVVVAWGATAERCCWSQDWPGFRGGRSAGETDAALGFRAGRDELVIRWKQPLGKGYSGVSVRDELVVTMYSDGTSDRVAAFHAEDGRRLWTCDLGETYRGHDGSQDGPISTPFLDGTRVFALGPRGNLVALDAASGAVLWKADLPERFESARPHWGFGTSPIVHQGVLLVQVGGKGAMVAGLDPATGQTLWSAGDDTVYYQSPAPMRDGRAILAAGNTRLFAIDPKSGQVLWQFEHGGAGEYGSICMSPLEVAPGRFLLEHQDDMAMLITAPANGGADATRDWEAPLFPRSYSPAVAHGDLLFGYHGRTLACAGARTAEVLWRNREPGDGFMVRAGDELVIVTKRGSVHVAAARPDRYAEFGRLTVFSDLVWSPPAVAGGSIYLRSFGELARIDVRRGRPAVAAAAPPPDTSGTQFGEFVKHLESSADPSAAIDEFLKTSGPFPMIEPDGRVVFVYRGPGKDLAIGGDLTGFGRKLLMHRVSDTDLFFAVARLEPDARVAYAFVRDYQALADPLNPRRITADGYDDDLEFSYTATGRELSWLAMPEWQAPPYLSETDAAPRGRVESRTLRSEALDADVAVDVYLPAGYDAAEQRFPVAYLHGGTPADGPLQIPRALDSLIGRRVQPMLAVFIRHMPPFGDATAYARMAGVELPAFIDEHYRTIATRDGRGHVGWSFYAYPAMCAVFLHPERSSRIALQSPFLLQRSYLDPVMERAGEGPFTIYLDWGTYDLRSPLEFWSTPEMARGLAEYLVGHGHACVGGEAHDGSGPSSWQNRLGDVFATLFPVKNK